MIFTLEYIGVNIIENAPFKIERPDGSYRHIFFHFTSQVTLKIQNQEIVCAPGTCILYEPNVSQHFYVNNNRLNHDFIDFILLEPNFFKDINFPINTPFTPKDSKTINDFFCKIQEEKSSSKIGNNYKYQSSMIDLFVFIARKINSKKIYDNENFQNELKSKFENLRLTIYEKPDYLKISTMAKNMGFSISRFNELYKKHFNCTPIQDLTKARVARVKELINEGYRTKEIIKIIGFTSDEYFYRWFKKHFNSTKNEYLENNKL